MNHYQSGCVTIGMAQIGEPISWISHSSVMKPSAAAPRRSSKRSQAHTSGLMGSDLSLSPSDPLRPTHVLLFPPLPSLSSLAIAAPSAGTSPSV